MIFLVLVLEWRSKFVVSDGMRMARILLVDWRQIGDIVCGRRQCDVSVRLGRFDGMHLLLLVVWCIPFIERVYERRGCDKIRCLDPYKHIYLGILAHVCLGSFVANVLVMLLIDVCRR